MYSVQKIIISFCRTCTNPTGININGVEYCGYCETFICPQCGVAIISINGKCTGCNNYVAVKSLVFVTVQ